MSTYRYRDTAGGINGAYGILTADTFTATTSSATTLSAVTLNVSGTSTQAQINCTGVSTGNVTATSLNVSGLSTMGQINNTGLVRILLTSLADNWKCNCHNLECIWSINTSSN